MSGSLTNHAEEIAFAAQVLPNQASRAAFLEQACSGDPALRMAVQQILAESAEIERLLEESRPAREREAEVIRLLAGRSELKAGAVDTFNADQLVGSRIGPYLVLEKLGEGGCGAVYLADQEKPIRRQVAIKVIKLGMDTKQVIARFEAERQALALMDHPNIARVLDAGATETGRPYFVMEVVRGIKITQYCEENRLVVPRRLELFMQVCSAIQHAHQKGIVHRDLKPSNVLVSNASGEPLLKVIDFGIAKATGCEPLTENTPLTVCEQFLGTPAYMSPEQALVGGLDVDTRGDIYSLGVLLYELLTGRTPFDQAELLEVGLDEMRRILAEREPRSPSDQLGVLGPQELLRVAHDRQMEPARLRTLLQGDLDSIILKSLEKDRNRRYQTVNTLAMDVQRFLRDEPVFARPPSRMYRLGKLVRRNRTMFAATTSVALALVAGFGTSTWLFFKEREARHEADDLRVEADARAKISQAALLINRHQMKEADRWVSKIQVPATEPSFEAASVFRALGEWNVSQGRWKAAADRFLKLERANQVDKSNMTEEISRDLLGAGPVLIVAGELEKYREFVKATLGRFARTADPVAAEQVIKNSLILPPDPAILRQLEPLERLAEQSISKAGVEGAKQAYYLSWRSLAVALYKYRCGDFAGAVCWGEKSLGYPDSTPPRIAMAHVVLAMAFAQLGQPDKARPELEEGREPVLRRLPQGAAKIVGFGSPSAGVWHDWVIAYLLLQEAEGMVKLP